MFRDKQEWLWTTKELATRIGEGSTASARAATYLSCRPLFYGVNWDPRTGFIESFSLAEPVLDEKPIHLV